MGSINHGGNHHADTKDLHRAAVIQHRLVETADRAGDIVFPRLQLIDFLVNTRAGNINEAGAYSIFHPV